MNFKEYYSRNSLNNQNLGVAKICSASIFAIDLRGEGSPVLRHSYRFTRSNDAAKKPSLLVSPSAQVAPCVPLRNRGSEFSLSPLRQRFEIYNFKKCRVQHLTVCYSLFNQRYKAGTMNFPFLPIDKRHPIHL